MLVWKVVDATYDIVRGVNVTVWGGVKGAEKVRKIVKTCISAADVVIGTIYALFGRNDYIWASLDVIVSVSSAVGLVLGNIPSTKSLTVITGSITTSCRSVRY